MDDASLKKVLVDFLADVIMEARAKVGTTVENHLRDTLEKERLLVVRARETLEAKAPELGPMRGQNIPDEEALWNIEDFARIMKFPTTDAARRFVKAHLPPDCRAVGVGRRVKLIPSRVKRALGLPS